MHNEIRYYDGYCLSTAQGLDEQQPHAVHVCLRSEVCTATSGQQQCLHHNAPHQVAEPVHGTSRMRISKVSNNVPKGSRKQTLHAPADNELQSTPRHPLPMVQIGSCHNAPVAKWPLCASTADSYSGWTTLAQCMPAVQPRKLLFQEPFVPLFFISKRPP